MNTLKNIILAATTAVLLGGTAFAAEPGVNARIPFDFTIGNCTLPAGEYGLRPANQGGDVVRLMNLETGKSILVLMQPGAPHHAKNTTASGLVTFHRYGNRHFFAGVWAEDDSLSRHVTPSKSEREYKLTNPNVDMALASVPLVASR